MIKSTETKMILKLLTTVTTFLGVCMVFFNRSFPKMTRKLLFCNIAVLDLNIETNEEININNRNEKDTNITTTADSSQNIVETISAFITNHPYIIGIILTIILALIIDKGYEKIPNEIQDRLPADISLIPSISDEPTIQSHLGCEFLSDCLNGRMPLAQIIGNIYDNCIFIELQIIRKEILDEAVLNFIKETNIQLDILEKAELLDGVYIIHLTDKLQEILNLIT